VEHHRADRAGGGAGERVRHAVQQDLVRRADAAHEAVVQVDGDRVDVQRPGEMEGDQRIVHTEVAAPSHVGAGPGGVLDVEPEVRGDDAVGQVAEPAGQRGAIDGGHAGAR